MNVAVVLTGHMRCWKQVFPNFKERIIDRYNPDIFIHTWDDEGYRDPSDSLGFANGSPKIDIREVCDAYDPIELNVETFEDLHQSFIDRSVDYTQHHVTPKNLISMLSKMSRGILMMENHMCNTGKYYDLILRLRPDLIYHEDLPDFNPNIFYTNRHTNHMGKGTGDMMHVGNIFNMTLFNKIIHFLPQLYSEVGYVCPHEMSSKFISKLGIPWQEFYVNKTLMHTPKGEYVPRENW